MKLDQISCNNCGAPLEVPEGTNFASCRHCGSRLAVRRTESASFTEVITDLKEQVEKLTRQNEIDALDREWEAEKERFMVTGKHGHRHLPTRTGSLAGGIMITVFGIFWTAMAAGIAGFTGRFGGGPFGRLFSCFPLFGVVFIVFGIGMSIISYNKAGEYEKALRRYNQRREEMLRQNRS
jgi:DNA-directed RNA polymerase subunit RPC12/RpoP